MASRTPAPKPAIGKTPKPAVAKTPGSSLRQTPRQRPDPTPGKSPTHLLLSTGKKVPPKIDVWYWEDKKDVIEVEHKPILIANLFATIDDDLVTNPDRQLEFYKRLLPSAKEISEIENENQGLGYRFIYEMISKHPDKNIMQTFKDRHLAGTKIGWSDYDLVDKLYKLGVPAGRPPRTSQPATNKAYLLCREAKCGIPTWYFPVHSPEYNRLLASHLRKHRASVASSNDVLVASLATAVAAKREIKDFTTKLHAAVSRCSEVSGFISDKLLEGWKETLTRTDKMEQALYAIISCRKDTKKLNELLQTLATEMGDTQPEHHAEDWDTMGKAENMTDIILAMFTELLGEVTKYIENTEGTPVNVTKDDVEGTIKSLRTLKLKDNEIPIVLNQPSEAMVPPELPPRQINPPALPPRDKTRRISMPPPPKPKPISILASVPDLKSMIEKKEITLRRIEPDTRPTKFDEASQLLKSIKEHNMDDFHHVVIDPKPTPKPLDSTPKKTGNALFLAMSQRRRFIRQSDANEIVEDEDDWSSSDDEDDTDLKGRVLFGEPEEEEEEEKIKTKEEEEELRHKKLEPRPVAPPPSTPVSSGKLIPKDTPRPLPPRAETESMRGSPIPTEIVRGKDGITRPKAAVVAPAILMLMRNKPTVAPEIIPQEEPDSKEQIECEYHHHHEHDKIKHYCECGSFASRVCNRCKKIFFCDAPSCHERYVIHHIPVCKPIPIQSVAVYHAV